MFILIVVAFLSDGTPRVTAFDSPDMASCAVTESIVREQLAASAGVTTFITKCKVTGPFES